MYMIYSTCTIRQYLLPAWWYTGEPRLARELCPKKPRANQNRTNQGSILLYTHQNWPKISTIARNIVKKIALFKSIISCTIARNLPYFIVTFLKLVTQYFLATFISPKPLSLPIHYNLTLITSWIISGSKCVIARTSH